MNPFISVNNMSVDYNGLPVLKDINFQAEKGEFVAIVGKSGSGKTTFLYALAGLIQFAGQILIPQTIGVVFQQYAVFPWLSVVENIGFGLEQYSISGKEQITRGHLALADLQDKKDKYPAELSGGQIQRVALARSLAHNPEVLLMDEPYGALDAYTRDKMQQWLLDVWSADKKTVIFVTHNIEEAIFLADRVLVLNQGRFIREHAILFPRPRKEIIKYESDFNQIKKSIYDSLN